MRAWDWLKRDGRWLEALTVVLSSVAIGLSIFVWRSEVDRADHAERAAERVGSVSELRDGYSRMTDLIGAEPQTEAIRAELVTLADRSRAIERRYPSAVLPTDLSFLGAVHMVLGRPDIAAAYYRKGIAAVRADGSPDASFLVESLTSLAEAQYRRNRIEAGNASYAQALSVAESAFDEPRVSAQRQAYVWFERAASEAIAGRCDAALASQREGEAANMAAGYNLAVSGGSTYRDFVALCPGGGSPRDRRPVG